MTRQMTQPEMAAYDAQQFKLMNQRELTIRNRDQQLSAAHRMAGDKRFRGGWATDDAEVLRYLRESDPRATALLRAIERLDLEIEDASRQVGEMEAFYRNAPWPRYFPCLNRDGHIHSSLRACPTVRWETSMGWATEMSGLTADQAIHEGIPGQFPGLGETLCSVCFPEAPVEWCRTRSEIEREGREAAKAEREAAKYVKRLFPSEQFRTTGRFGERVETVAKCKELLRLEVELRDYYGHGEHPDHTASVADAEKAAKVLLAREERQAGTGATQAQVDQIIANAVRANRKNGARI